MSNLTITSTQILPISNGKGGCVAIAQLVFNDALKVTGIKLIDNGEKRWISYPRNMSNKQKKSFFFPIHNDIAETINTRVWEDYNALNASK